MTERSTIPPHCECGGYRPWYTSEKNALAAILHLANPKDTPTRLADQGGTFASIDGKEHAALRHYAHTLDDIVLSAVLTVAEKQSLLEIATALRNNAKQAFDTPRLCDLCGKEQAKDADAYCKGHGEPAVCRITVNMVQHDVEGNAISYEQVAALAGKPGATHLTMTYSRRGDGGGSLIPGERVELFDDMHFCAVNTGNA